MSAVSRMDDYRREGSPPMDMLNTLDAEVEAAGNIAAEQSLLGAILVNNEALDQVGGFLEPEHFFEPVHREIYGSIRAKIAMGRKVDPIMLIREMRDETVGDMSGAQYVARLAAEATTIVNAQNYGLEILEAYATRHGLAFGRDAWKAFAGRRYDTTITSILSDLEDKLADLRALTPQSSGDDLIGSAVDRLLQTVGEKKPAGMKPIPHPLPEIGSVLQESGFQVGNLYGLLGASGEGKTSLLLQIVRSAMEAGHPVLVMSYDQTDQQVVRQMISQATGISVSQMIRHDPPRRETLNDHEFGLMYDEGERIKALAPLTVRALSDHKIGAIISLSKRWAKKVRKMQRPDGSEWNAPLIVLDHNRKVRADDPRADAGTKAANVNGAGKALARDLNAVVLFLNQRNGKGMDRYVPRPIAEDLYGGESAKEDYDAILYIYRPERWRDEQLSVAKDAVEAGKIRNRFMLRRSWEDEPRDPEGMAEIGAIKTRYGAGGVKEFVKFEGRYTRYVSERQAPAELF